MLQVPGVRRRTRSESQHDDEGESGAADHDSISLVDKYAIQAMRRLATEGVYSLKDHEELPVVLLSPQASRRGKQPTGMNPSSRASASVDCPIVISIPSSPVEASSAFVLPDEAMECQRWHRATGGPTVPDYDLDSDDEEWLDEYNGGGKHTRAGSLQPHALELSMAFILGGRGNELRDFGEISQHVDAITRHTQARIKADGRRWLLPTTQTPSSPSLALDTDDQVYECFVPYTINEEPMSAASQSPVTRVATPAFRPRKSLRMSSDWGHPSHRATPRKPLLAVSPPGRARTTATGAGGLCPAAPPSGDRGHRARVRRRSVKRFSGSPSRGAAGKTRQRRVPLNRISVNQ